MNRTCAGRRIVAGLLILLLAAPATQAQVRSQREDLGRAAPVIRPQLRYLPIVDPAVAALQEMRDAIARRVLERGVPLSLLADAYKAGDHGTIAGLLGFTDRELAEMDQNLLSLREDLIRRYPSALEVELEYNACFECNVDTAFRLIENHLSQVDTDPHMEPEEGSDETSCKWVLYLGALIACTNLGPILYWPCAYVAYCSFCKGKLVEQICYN